MFSIERRGGTARVWIGGTLVLDSADEADPTGEGGPDISEESAPVTLTAGTAIPLRVEYVFDADIARAESEDLEWQKELEHGWCHLFLRWRGSTGEAAVVAGDVLSAAGESGAVRSCYGNLELEGDAATSRASEIGFLLGGGAPESARRPLQRQMAERALARAESAEFLASDDLSDLFWLSREAAEYTTVSEKASILKTLARNPGAMADIPAGEIDHLLNAHRYMLGAETTDVVAQWCTLDPAVGIEFGIYPSWSLEQPSYLHQNFGGYWHMAPKLTGDDELNQIVAATEEPDGSCNLRAARIAAFAHRAGDRLTGWTQYLDGVLAREGLSGNTRVSWLLARAYAEELAERETPIVLAGRTWLEEALENAESEPVKVRVIGEITAREAALGRGDAARALLDEHAQSVSAESRGRFASWRGRVEGIEAYYAAQVKRQEREQREAYVAELEDRLARAERDGDPVRIERYRRRLEGVGR